MINYGIQHGSVSPQPVEITATSVFLASNIQKVSRELNSYTIEEYEYELTSYTKDEYIAKLSQDNAALQQQVLETQLALCDLYESLEGEGGL